MISAASWLPARNGKAPGAVAAAVSAAAFAAGVPQSSFCAIDGVAAEELKRRIGDGVRDIEWRDSERRAGGANHDLFRVVPVTTNPVMSWSRAGGHGAHREVGEAFRAGAAFDCARDRARRAGGVAHGAIQRAVVDRDIERRLRGGGGSEPSRAVDGAACAVERGVACRSEGMTARPVRRSHIHDLPRCRSTQSDKVRRRVAADPVRAARLPSNVAFNPLMVPLTTPVASLIAPRKVTG